MVKIAVIQRLLNNLASYANDLRNATDITHEKYIKDIRLQRFVERTLQISIECCFDVVHHIISDKGFREPDSYADAFTVLAEQGVLSQASVHELHQPLVLGRGHSAMRVGIISHAGEAFAIPR